MEIKDAAILKAKLEVEIKTLIKKFEVETGITVKELNYSTMFYQECGIKEKMVDCMISLVVDL